MSSEASSRVEVRIAESRGEADLARARQQAQQAIVVAEADLTCARRQAEQTVQTAEAESKQRLLIGRAEGQREMQVGLSEAAVLLRKISSYGDPRLYSLSTVAEHLSHSNQPLVPERLFVAGGEHSNGDGNGKGSSLVAGGGMLGVLVNLLVAEKSGFAMAGSTEADSLKELADRFAEQAMQNLEQGVTTTTAAITEETGAG